MALLRIRTLLPFLIAAAVLAPVWAQEEEMPPERATKPPVMLTFTPPDLEGTIVLGIFDDAGKLKRTLRFEPGAPELKIDTNGYIAQWDGHDETGRACMAGRYSARGYVVGEEVEVEGDAFYFNDWMAEDQIPAQDVHLRQWPDGIGVELTTAKGPVFRRVEADGSLLAAQAPMEWKVPSISLPPLSSPPLGEALGRDGTSWLILDADGQHVVAQFGKGQSSERELRVPREEPQPVEILASEEEDAILLKEIGKNGIQRVRMLKRGKAATQAEGRVVADWEVVFERTLEPCADFGVIDGKLVANAGGVAPQNSFEEQLVENALEPGKKSRLQLKAVGTAPGSSLQAADGLTLVEISSDGDWKRFATLAKGAEATLYQGDGIVVEAFKLRGLDHFAAFDAGSFLLAPAAE